MVQARQGGIMMRRLLVLTCLLFGLGAFAQAAETEKDIQRGSVESRLNALASIQPGLGVVMHEMGYRFSNIYWAANGGNWGLAQYQLKELLEAQEVAEVTRPQRAPMLKAFEVSYLVPLGRAIEKKDVSQFKRSFSAAMNGCNACHTALGYQFIHYRVPKQSSHEVLDFILKTDPRYEEAAEAK
jgi:cytochrome c553